MGEAGYRLEATLPSPSLDVRHDSGVLRGAVAICDVEHQHLFQVWPRRCAGAFEALQMWVVVSRAARYHALDPTHATKEVNTNGLVITQRCKYGSSWHVSCPQFESILATSSHLFLIKDRMAFCGTKMQIAKVAWYLATGVL